MLRDVRVGIDGVGGRLVPPISSFLQVWTSSWCADDDLVLVIILY